MYDEQTLMLIMPDPAPPSLAASGSTTNETMLSPSRLSVRRDSSIARRDGSSRSHPLKVATSTLVLCPKQARNASTPASVSGLPSSSSETSVELLAARASKIAPTPASPTALSARKRSTTAMFCSRHDASALAPASPIPHPLSHSCRTWVLSLSASASLVAPALPIRRPERSMPVTRKSSSRSRSRRLSKLASTSERSASSSSISSSRWRAIPHPATSSVCTVPFTASIDASCSAPSSPTSGFRDRVSTPSVVLSRSASASSPAPSPVIRF
mmetsp:Transcript_21333/g.48104  ORF Transcript_21333/g.48104 Transcript_21333/m.48104 type:complete len:271 (-) Transcript_21333:545-1357(-)